jgi:ABC-type multidrug transport system fused ATPase/permease subunit
VLPAPFEQVVKSMPHGGNPRSDRALAAGYQTEIGQRSVGLSGGQKKRLVICTVVTQATKDIGVR